MNVKMIPPNAAGSGGGKVEPRRPGWLLIAAVAVVTLLFLVLGTMDADFRYDLIGL